MDIYGIQTPSGFLNSSLAGGVAGPWTENAYFVPPTKAFFQTTGGEMLIAAAIGIASHHGFYRHGEHHMEAPYIFWLHIFLASGLLYVKTRIADFKTGSVDACLIFSSYLGAMMASIVTYRLFFHRLRKFPGPTMASATKLWHSAKCIDCKNHVLLDDLHKQYGDFVRTGPSEITVFKPEVKWAVDGPLNKCTKAVWYDILLPLQALNTLRGKPEHDHRRRAWDAAITKKTLEGYQKRIYEHVKLLEQIIHGQAGKPINITKWFYFLAFDVMGDFAYAKSFDMLESRSWHYAVVLLRRALCLLGPLSSVPWLAQLAFSMPIIPIIRDWNRMLAWCTERMDEQVAAEQDLMDANISSWLIHQSKKNNTLQEDVKLLRGDSVALIVAGSDTVASTMTNMVYRMALHPEHADRVRDELDTLASLDDAEGLKNLPHFNGCISEVLRLHPSVPTGGYRESPPEGMEVAGTYIPGNTTIVAPRYTLGRLEESFERAEEFIPERWYSKPEMVADKKSFNPFAIGRYACVGKKLALSEIRFVIAVLLSKYDITFAPGSDPDTVWKELRDQFTAVPGPLQVVFTPRTVGE